MSIDLPVTVRFIEYCPTNKHTQPAEDYMPYQEIRRIIEDAFGFLSSASIRPGNGPAVYFKIRNSAGAIGFISGRSTIFCETCNRIRLSCDGKIKPCLYSAEDYDIGRLVRGCESDEHIRTNLEKIITNKHTFTKLNSPVKEFSMRKVGG